jgi:hypothetical protein
MFLKLEHDDWQSVLGASRYKLPGLGCPERGAPTDYVTHVFVITCRLYKLHLPHQAHVTLHLSVSLSDFVQRYFSRSPLFLAGGGWVAELFFPHRGTNPLLVALMRVTWKEQRRSAEQLV